MPLERFRLDDVGVVAPAGSQFVVEKIESFLRLSHRIYLDSTSNIFSRMDFRLHWLNHTEAAVLPRSLNEFKELTGTRVDPGNSTTVERHGGNRRTHDDAAVTL